MAVLGSAALLTAEVDAGIEIFKLLEPEIQKGFIEMFHLLLHHKQSRLVKTETGAPFADDESTSLATATQTAPTPAP